MDPFGAPLSPLHSAEDVLVGLREAAAPCEAAALAGITQLCDMAAALAARCAGSAARCDAWLQDMVQELDLEARGTLRSEAALTAGLEKEMDGWAEGEKATGEQLAAYACMLEAAVLQGELGGPVLAPRSLLLLAGAGIAPAITSFVTASLPAFAVDAVAASCRLRDGVDPSACTVSGHGLEVFVAGDTDTAFANNSVEVWVRDAAGEAVDSLHIVDVSVAVEGGSVARVRVGTCGDVGIVYNVPAGHITPLALSIRLFGVPLKATPWKIEVSVCVCLPM